MEIICLASSSAGNAYVVRNEKHAILLEAGIDFRLLKTRLLDHRIVLTALGAVAITHSHGDHSRASEKVSRFMPVIASEATLKNIMVLPNRGYPLNEWQKVYIGSFELTGFFVPHDCDGAMGFIIHDRLNDEKLIFVNDANMVIYHFKESFDYIMIECNHVNDILISNADDRAIRVAKSHMSLETLKIVLAKSINNFSRTKAIYLMHLSDGNSDQNRMIKEIEKQTGVPTYACLKDGGVTSG